MIVNGKNQQSIVIFLVIFVLLVSGCEKKSVKIPANLVFEESEGDKVILSDLFKSPLTLVVRASLWDEVSIEQLRKVNMVFEKFGGKKIGIVVFIFDEKDLAQIRRFKYSEGFQFPFIKADALIVKIFGEDEIVPTILLINRERKIVKKIQSYIDEKTLETTIKGFL